MDKFPSVEVTIHIEGGDAFPAGLVAQTIGIVERSAFTTEAEELEAIFEEFPDIPELVRDACRQRLNNFRGNTLLVSAAAPGSFVIAATCTALAYWLVEKTLGETVKEAYKESDLHKKLKELLARRLFRRTQNLASTVHNAVFVPVYDPTIRAEARVSKANPRRVEVIARLEKWQDVPPSNDAWVKSGEPQA
jgi:hypothetical protein